MYFINKEMKLGMKSDFILFINFYQALTMGQSLNLQKSMSNTSLCPSHDRKLDLTVPIGSGKAF